MIGVVVNTVAVIIGSLIGVLCKKGIPERVSNTVMLGVGLCVIYIGVDGMLGETNPLVAVVSIVVGAIIGTLIDIDKGLNSAGDKLSAKVSRGDRKSVV